MKKQALQLIEQISTINGYKPIVFLVGSYALDTQTSGSDIDILILIDKPDKNYFVKELKTLVKKEFSQLMEKLDCKVLTKTEVRRSRSLKYLFLLSAFQNSIQYTELRFVLKFSPFKLRDSIIELENRLHSIQEDINVQRNFDIAVFSLFTVTKSLYYLDGLIRPFQKRKTPKNVLCKYFYPFSRIYESLTKKGILDNVNLILMKRGQKSGKFHDLEGAFRLVKKYFDDTKAFFSDWYDLQVL